MNTVDQKKLATAAICGLFCEGCGLYIASREDKTRLEKIADRYNMTPEEVKCDGCRSERLGPYCRTCKMKPCAIEKGFSFCSECSEYPCQSVIDFQAQPQVAHRLEVFQSLDRIKEVGYDTWHEEMIKHYSCNQCETINSAYDISCRKCGSKPGNTYIKEHLEEIKNILAPVQKK